MQSSEPSSDRFPVPSEPPDAPVGANQQPLFEECKFSKISKFMRSWGRPGQRTWSATGWRLGPTTEREQDMVVKCHCTVDTMVRDDCYGPPVVPQGPGKHCTALYRPVGALYTFRNRCPRSPINRDRGRSAGPYEDCLTSPCHIDCSEEE